MKFYDGKCDFVIFMFSIFILRLPVCDKVKNLKAVEMF